MSLRDNRFLRSLYYRWKCYEAKHSYNHGKDNRIKNRGVIIGSRIQFNGRGNELVVEDGAVLLNCTVRITGNDCRVILCKRCYVTEAEIFVENNGCVVEIGQHTFIGRQTHIACTEDGSKLIIGGYGMIYLIVRFVRATVILFLIAPAGASIMQHLWTLVSIAG